MNSTIEGFIPGIAVGTVIGGIVFFIIFTIIIFALAFYVYFSLAWMTLANKLKYKNSFLAWIPFARSGMILQLGEFHWALVFLYLVPFLGWIALFILLIIAKWRIFEKRKYPGWLSLLILVPYAGFIAHAIVMGIVAWDDKKSH